MKSFESRIPQQLNLTKRHGLDTLDLSCEQFADVVGGRGVLLSNAVSAQRLFAVSDFQILIAEFQSYEESLWVEGDGPRQQFDPALDVWLSSINLAVNSAYVKRIGLRSARRGERAAKNK